MTATASKRVGTNLTEGVIWKVLITFALPIILTNVIQQLYSMVDLMIAGKFVGGAGTIGVSTGGELADFMTPVAMALASAGQIYIAQLVGAKKMQEVKNTIGTLLALSFLVSFVLMIGAIVFCDPFLRLMNCPELGFEQARGYLIITALGYPFIFGYNAVCGVLRGMGEAKRPLMFIIVAATVNIFADLLLVVVFPLEAIGTAIATVLSQLGSFLAAFLFMYRRKESFDFELKLRYFKIEPHAAKTIVRLSVPQLCRSLLVRVSMMYVNASCNGYGAVYSQTNSIGNKIQKFLEVFMMGIDTASATMIGQNLGAKKHDRAAKTVWTTLWMSMAVAVFASVLAWVIPRQMFSLFTIEGGMNAFVAANITRGAREAVNLIRSAVEDPDVFVLVTSSMSGDVEPFFYEVLEPLTIIDIGNPTESEREGIWTEIMQNHPSTRDLDLKDLVRFSAGMARYDIYVAAREAVEEAYKTGLVQRGFVPVTAQNMFDKLASSQPFDSDEYRALEDKVVSDFVDGLDDLERLLGGQQDLFE